MSEFTEYIEKRWKGKTLNRLDLHEITWNDAFRIGYETAIEKEATCPCCKKDNELHPSMRWCHTCRNKRSIN